jgi:hypothetical protein
MRKADFVFKTVSLSIVLTSAYHLAVAEKHISFGSILGFSVVN